MQAGSWFLLSRCVREKQRSVGELLPCTCGQEAQQSATGKLGLLDYDGKPFRLAERGWLKGCGFNRSTHRGRYMVAGVGTV
ncbi:hypothetical protein GCM10009582_09520 [Arthrobacter flavus]